MKKIITISLLALVCIMPFAGCVTKNPSAVQAADGSWNKAPYQVDPRFSDTLNSISNKARLVNDATGSLNPYHDTTNTALTWGFGALALIGGFASKILAGQKNKAFQVISTMSDGIVKAGAQSTVIEHASNTDHADSVFSAINASLGANQAPTSSSSPKV